MNKTISQIFVISCLAFPSYASTFTPQFEFTPVLEHLVKSWDYKHNSVTQELWKELSVRPPEESCDIISKTCGLCSDLDSPHEKASVGLTFCMSKSTERDEIARLAWGLKRHFGNLNKDISVLDILNALTSVPGYQRPTIYAKIQQEEAAINHLFTYVSNLSQQFGILEKLSMQFHYQTFGWFSFGNEMAESIQPKLF